VPDTFIKIASVTVGSGGAASIDFTSIPSTYTDLVVKGSVRTDAGTAYGVVYLSVNGVTTNQSRVRIFGDGASAGTDIDSSQSLALVSGNGATANTFGTFEMYIPNYTGSSVKSLSWDSVGETNATTIYAQLLAGLWNQTTAITSIGFTAGFMQYSTATLYGIKNS
jgi:hypothetical protein